MATVTLKGNPVSTNGTLPAVSSKAPAFALVGTGLGDVDNGTFPGKLVLNIFPSVDTGTCATSVRQFNARAGAIEGVTVLNVSKDLPFAFSRFCGAEGIENVESASAFRSSFAADYGVEMTSGPLTGLCARAIVVIDAAGTVLHTELVGEIVDEPNYDAALAAL
jgi:thiol peroxidase